MATNSPTEWMKSNFSYRELLTDMIHTQIIQDTADNISFNCNLYIHPVTISDAQDILRALRQML
jgi:hypothetical protein